MQTPFSRAPNGSSRFSSPLRRGSLLLGPLAVVAFRDLYFSAEVLGAVVLTAGAPSLLAAGQGIAEGDVLLANAAPSLAGAGEGIAEGDVLLQAGGTLGAEGEGIAEGAADLGNGSPSLLAEGEGIAEGAGVFTSGGGTFSAYGVLVADPATVVRCVPAGGFVVREAGWIVSRPVGGIRSVGA